MREAFLALGILSATVAAAPASAQTDGDRAAAEPKVKKNWVKPEFCGPITEAYSSPRGPREALRLHSRENGFARPPAVSLQTALAIRLGVLETRIGVRAEQLNAWRDYTSALQELLRPPGDRSLSAAGHTEAPPEAASGGPNDPFAFEEKLAEDFATRAAVAEKLKVAITALRNTLTSEQQDILASTELLPGPPPGSWMKGTLSERQPGPEQQR
jgi:hypothetical protein